MSSASKYRPTIKHGRVHCRRRALGAFLHRTRAKAMSVSIFKALLQYLGIEKATYVCEVRLNQ